MEENKMYEEERQISLDRSRSSRLRAVEELVEREVILEKELADVKRKIKMLLSKNPLAV